MVKLRLKLSACETNWVKLMSRLNISTTSRMIAKIIQPRLLRGLGEGGGVMTGGGVTAVGRAAVKPAVAARPANQRMMFP